MVQWGREGGSEGEMEGGRGEKEGGSCEESLCEQHVKQREADSP